MKVLITGGAGYIGSTVASAFADAGDQVVLLDDLSSGSRTFLDTHAGYLGDVADRALLDRIFRDHADIALTVHCAARTVVPDSLADPVGYYRNNVEKTIALLEALLAHRCSRLIFSSSAAVYGGVAADAVSEDEPVRPESPYAAGKVAVERILEDVCGTENLRALSMRYFNPIGADPLLRAGPHASRFQPVLGAMLNAHRNAAPFFIHGTDWPTRDGTPLRDFVDVWDVARAHVTAVRHWPDDGRAHHIVNIGSGTGTTVAELARVASAQLPAPLHVEDDGRRAGDVRGCRADIHKAAELFGWRPQRSVVDAVRAAVRWQARAC